MWEVENGILGMTDEPALHAQFHDRNRSKTSEMSWKMALTTASTSPASRLKPDSTFSTPPSASRCLITDWTAGPLGTVDPSSTKSDSGFDDVAFTAGNEQTGYLLNCGADDPFQVYSTTRDLTENIVNPRALYEVRQISSSDLCFDKNGDGEEAHVHIPNLTSSDTDSASTGSSTISLPSPKSTPISSPIVALPTVMSPVETVKPCPQHCRCHGYANSSTSTGNMIYPMPDLLNYTTPDKFSITSSTPSMTSPLVCPRPFQPPVLTSFQPFRSGIDGDEGRYSAPSTGSSLVSAAAASDIKQGPNGQGGAYPIQVIPSALLASLVQEGHVGKGIGNELTTPATASTITSSTSEMERIQEAVPTSFFANCDIQGDDVITRASPVVNSHTSHYPQAYPRPYLARFQAEFPHRLPTEHLLCPSSEYFSPGSSHLPVGNPHHPGRSLPGYNLTPGYHGHPPPIYPAHPPPDYTSSLILSRLLAPRSLTATCDPRMSILPPERSSLPCREDGQPRTSVVDKEKVGLPPQKRRPKRRPGRSLVDQFPDLLPVIAWCIKYSQATTLSSQSLSKPTLSAKKIQEIVVECIPGIKERGGIGIYTIRRIASDVRRKMQDESATPSSTSLPSQVPHSVMKENNAKHPNDLISTSFMNEDSELPRAPTESILRSIMKLVDNMPKTDKHSRSTATTTATGRIMMSHDHKLDPDRQQKTDANTEPEIAVDDERIDGANDPTKCSDCDSDDDLMVIDEVSWVI